MTATDLQRLQEEHDAICRRLETAPEVEREQLGREFDERLSHLKSRLEAAAERGAPAKKAG
ncbi:MAG TPA: hypothetical protein VF614_12640 [Chthoniobacteraceae bacterium]|jgi:hypothetical protein